MIFKSKFPPRDFPKVTLYQLLFDGNKRIVNENPCFVDAEDHSKSISFADLKKTALRFGAGLKRVFPDFTQGDVIAVYSPNDINYMPIFYGVVAIGGVVATIDHTCDSEAAASCLKTVNASIIFAHPETIERGIDAARIAGIPNHNIFILGSSKEEVRSFHETFLSHDELAVPIEYTPEEHEKMPCYLYFTSGTTGEKKAVVLTQSTLVCALTMFETWFPSTMSILSHSDLYHVSTLVMTMHLNVIHGCTTYILNSHVYEKILAAIQECKINAIVTHAWVISSMAKEPMIYDISSLKYAICTGGAIAKTVCQSFYERFQIPVFNGYGSTEVLGPFQSDIQTTMAGKIGWLSPGFYSKLIDDSGKEIEDYGVVGELYIKGPGLMPGYYKNELANAKVFDKDGYFHTGDLFQIDQDGQFTYIDRINDIIRFRFFTIPPQEIEDVMITHPLVKDCAAVGIYAEDDSSWHPRAFVTLTENVRDTEKVHEEILQFAKIKLSDEKQLRGGLLIVKYLPRNSNGKIVRRALRQPDIEEWLRLNCL